MILYLYTVFIKYNIIISRNKSNVNKNVLGVKCNKAMNINNILCFFTSNKKSSVVKMFSHRPSSRSVKIGSLSKKLYFMLLYLLSTL